MTERERAVVEQMMRVVVAMQGLLDAVLSQGDLLLNPPGNTDAPSAPFAPQSAGLVEDPTDPPRLMHRPRAKVPTSPEGA